jgi:hypothetical protein
MSTNEDLLAETTTTLRAEANRLRGHLANLDAERLELRSKIDQLERAANILVPTARPAKKTRKVNKEGWISGEEAMRELLTSFLAEHREDLAEGFTITELFRRIRASGNAVVGRDRVAAMVETFHHEGAVRLDRRTVGGGKLYKLIGENGG